jgi:cysteine desulfurase family protein
MPPRIYLDNAATSWPKPEAVYAAVDDYQRRLGAPAGRGTYGEAAEVERLITTCRRDIAALIGAESHERIVFTLNGTDSLNLALHGMLRTGDHVVTTVCEHNSVLRPLAFLKQERDVSTTHLPCDGEGFVDPAAIAAAITPQTKLIALVHASNVTGAIQPAAEVGSIAKERGIPFLLDAAQSLGAVEIDVKTLGCQLLAAPGHKGLLGPLGTGLLYIAPGMEERLLPVRQGGTGINSDEEVQPATMPARYEAGNLNVPGIIGLGAGVKAVTKRGVAAIGQHERELSQRLLTGLQEISGVTIYGPSDASRRTGVVSFSLKGFDPQELAALLDSAFSIQLRAGLHCAPRMHAALRTLPRGTVRASIGPFSTAADVDALLAALQEVRQ